jgi:hypothetical protein
MEVLSKYSEDVTTRAAKAFRLSDDDEEHVGFIELLFGHESKLSK